jgi:hypothetical protein
MHALGTTFEARIERYAPGGEWRVRVGPLVISIPGLEALGARVTEATAAERRMLREAGYRQGPGAPERRGKPTGNPYLSGASKQYPAGDRIEDGLRSRNVLRDVTYR